MNSKIHIAVLYSVVVALFPVIAGVNSYFAKAEDVERTNAQTIFEIRQMGLSIEETRNDIQLQYYSNKMIEGEELKPYQEKDFNMLNEQKLMLIQQRSDLNKLRMGIK